MCAREFCSIKVWPGRRGIVEFRLALCAHQTQNAVSLVPKRPNHARAPSVALGRLSRNRERSVPATDFRETQAKYAHTAVSVADGRKTESISQR